jgi:hypothetical protein
MMFVKILDGDWGREEENIVGFRGGFGVVVEVVYDYAAAVCGQVDVHLEEQAAD